MNFTVDFLKVCERDLQLVLWESKTSLINLLAGLKTSFIRVMGNLLTRPTSWEVQYCQLIIGFWCL